MVLLPAVRRTPPPATIGISGDLEAALPGVSMVQGDESFAGGKSIGFDGAGSSSMNRNMKQAGFVKLKNELGAWRGAHNLYNAAEGKSRGNSDGNSRVIKMVPSRLNKQKFSSFESNIETSEKFRLHSFSHAHIERAKQQVAGSSNDIIEIESSNSHFLVNMTKNCNANNIDLTEETDSF